VESRNGYIAYTAVSILISEMKTEKGAWFLLYMCMNIKFNYV